MSIIIYHYFILFFFQHKSDHLVTKSTNGNCYLPMGVPTQSRTVLLPLAPHTHVLVLPPSLPIPPPNANMNFLLRASARGGEDIMRTANRILAQSRQRFSKKPRHEKPTTRRRREASEAVRRADRSHLLANLRVVMARKARGF